MVTDGRKALSNSFPPAKAGPRSCRSTSKELPRKDEQGQGGGCFW